MQIPVEVVPFEQLNSRHRGVEVKGMAHLVARVKGRHSETGVESMIFPLFPPGSMDSRMVHAIVRTDRELERGIGLAEMTVRGLAGPCDRFGEGLADAMISQGYQIELDCIGIDELALRD
jgi:hypothetical protein